MLRCINRFAVVFFLVATSPIFFYGGTIDALNEDIASLKLANCSPMATQLWDGRIVVNTARKPYAIYNRKEQLAPLDVGRFYSFTVEELEPRELVVPHLDRIISIGEESGIPYALGKTDNRLILVRKNGKEWEKIPNLPELRTSKDPRIIPSKQGLAILSEDYLFRFDNRNWLPSVSLPPKVALPERYRVDKWYQKQVLYGSQLFVGWNHGEGDSDDGLLAVLNLNDPNGQWKQINGNERATKQGIVGDGPIQDIALDGDGRLWVSADHGTDDGWVKRGIFRYNGIQWLTILNTHYDNTETQPRRPSFFSGGSGEFYAVDNTCGVLAFKSGKFKSLISIHWDEMTKKIPDGRGYSPDPCGLIVDSAGNVFVTTKDHFGVLCFIKAQKGYRLKQVVIPGDQFYSQ